MPRRLAERLHCRSPPREISYRTLGACIAQRLLVKVEVSGVKLLAPMREPLRHIRRHPAPTGADVA
jgi:hypothetical protein